MSKQQNIEKTPEEVSFFTYPKTFRDNDRAIIKIFGERLKSLRERRKIQSITDESILRKTWTLEAIGEELGITAQGYEKYEKGVNQTLPMKHIGRLCDIFDVTPHYLLGYASDEHSVVELDENNEIVMKDGKPNELKYVFAVPRGEQIKALQKYHDLIHCNAKLFILISKLMDAPEKKQSVCSSVLSILLEN